MALSPLAAARIGLARCRRPADVIAGVGWMDAINRIDPAEVSAVLRSWEDRSAWSWPG